MSRFEQLLFATLRRVRFALMRPQSLAFVPALGLAWYWFGGQGAGMVAALSLPYMVHLAGPMKIDDARATDALTGLANRTGLLAAIDRAAGRHDDDGQSAIVVALELDEFTELAGTLGTSGAEDVLRQVAERVRGALRPGDTPARLIGHRYGLCLAEVRQGGMDVGLTIAERLQAVIAEPISVNAGSIYTTASVGFCLARRAPSQDSAGLLQAAEIAMDEARRAGRGSVRAFSSEMAAALEARNGLAGELRAALEDGQIRPWFQPQVDAETGLLTGFEALVRWHHPVRGVLPPGDFLDTVDAEGLTERLGEVVLFQSLTALRDWDRAGFRVPRIGVNFSPLELRNPRLADRIRWELDRFDLTPDRLTVEILETVVAEAANDTIVRNIAALATLGCAIDLDDFGTGHASITNIRRFAVSRIKIDRSFVTHVDSDPNQKKMVSAILSMADQLGLATLAEGVETLSEHRMLAQMGCQQLQGYGIGRPMPMEDTEAWMRKYKARLETSIPSGPAHDRA